MGTRWEGVLASTSEDAVRALPAYALPLVDHASPAIRVTLRAFEVRAAAAVWSLELSGVNKNPLTMRTLPDNVAAALAGVDLPRDLSARCRSSAVFSLAVIASEQLGEVRWVRHSDGTCESATVRLGRGAIRHWSYSTSETHQGAYGDAGVAGITELLPDLGDIDELLDSMYSDDVRCLAWRLMDKRQRIDPPTPLT